MALTDSEKANLIQLIKKMSADAVLSEEQIDQQVESFIFLMKKEVGSGQATTDASQLTSGYINPDRVENGSIEESKLSDGVKAKLNKPMNIVLTQEDYDALTPDPDTTYDIIEA